MSNTLAAAIAALAASLPIAAGADHGHDGVARFTPLPAWQAECGSCHVAYPPSLLAAGEWRTVMSTLDRHYGTDASLDAATAQPIAAFLERNAGWPRGASAAKEPRITTAAWFVRKHRRFDAATWARPAIGSPSNCNACHAGAASGDFEEHAVRVPR
jgi:hypothetical protein